jgi:cytochrome c oxidase subunit 3/cytochrome o ubiquinol oxidase subunit 3
VATAHILSSRAETADWSLPSRRKIGVISLIVTETALFTIFAVAYLFYIGKSLTGPYPAQVLEPPILATICLLSSSVTIMLAERAFRTEATGSFRLWWLITIVLAVVFLGWTALEWRRLIYQHNLTIATNLFGTSFYSLVGLHATHVVAGLTLLTLVFWLSLRGVVTRSYSEHIEMISWYWHFVDAVWVVVFTVVYIIGR